MKTLFCLNVGEPLSYFTDCNKPPVKALVEEISPGQIYMRVERRWFCCIDGVPMLPHSEGEDGRSYPRVATLEEEPAQAGDAPGDGTRERG